MADKPRKHAIALHPYCGTSSGGRYLSFSAGARIEVVEEREVGGWWAGKLGGKLGWFPSSYCRVESAPAPAQSEPSLLGDEITTPAAGPKGAISPSKRPPVMT